MFQYRHPSVLLCCRGLYFQTWAQYLILGTGLNAKFKQLCSSGMYKHNFCYYLACLFLVKTQTQIVKIIRLK